MKKSSILILIIICLCSCGKSSKKVSITGEIKGLGTDTLYLYGMDRIIRPDRLPIFSEERTILLYSFNRHHYFCLLLIDNQTEYPIFLDKGNQIKIKGDINHPEYLDINGNIYNEEFTNFQKELNSLPTPSEKDLEQKAEEFIMKHHSSFVSLYLLDKYFVQKDSPDFNKIKKLIEVMTGILQDKLYIEQLNEAISLSEKTETGKYAPFFSLSNIKGEKITRSSEDFKKKNLLINFWASWGDSISNHQSNTELKEIYQKYKKNKHIAMLGISLDMDKQEWQDAIKRDTLNWEQVCDFGGLNSEVAKQYAIKQVPSNILLSADGKILAKNLKGEQLKKKIEEVVTAAEEKEKQDNKKKK